MNYLAVIQGLEFVVEHRKELAADAECAIHVIRRIEHLVVKHDTTADHVLVAAQTWLGHLAKASDTENPPTHTQKSG